MKKGRDRYLVVLASAVGLLCGFLWSDRPIVPEPPVPALTKQEKEAVLPPLPKEKGVRVTLEKEPPPPPIKAPSKSKKRRSEVISGVYRVNPSLVRSGMAMVGEKGEHLGSFPAVTANYRAKLGFQAYVSALQGLGAKFFIRDRNRKKLVAEVDFRTLYLNPVKGLEGLSPRSRIISGESAIRQYIDLAKVIFGKGDYQMIMLLPLRLDAAFIAGTEKALKRSGYNIREFHSLQAIYKKGTRGLSLVVVKGFHKSGRRVPLNLHFNLEDLREGHTRET